MYFYHHLGRGMKQFVERPDGLPVIYQEDIIIPLVAGQAEHRITDGVKLLTQYVAVGLWVVEPDSTPQKINEKLTTTTRAIFNSAYLTLKDNTAILLDKSPLRFIEKSNSNGHPYYLTPRGFINLVESKLDVWDNSGIGSNTGIKICVDYVIPTGKNFHDLVNLNK